MSSIELQPIEHDAQRVLTTKQLADLYDVEPSVVTKNFNRNQERFQEGIHFFRLQGDELRAFRTNLHLEGYSSMSKGQNDIYSPNTPQLLLWTERGALYHAKILNNDKAWEMYERLLDTYFRFKHLEEAVAARGGVAALTREDVGAMMDAKLAEMEQRMLAHLERYQNDILLNYNRYADNTINALDIVSNDIFAVRKRVFDAEESLMVTLFDIQEGIMLFGGFGEVQSTKANRRIDVVERCIRANIPEGFITVREYSTKHKLDLSLEAAKNLGRQVTQHCIENDIKYYLVAKSRAEWEKVHAYPEAILNEVFTQSDWED
jgi:hypothetical protein